MVARLASEALDTLTLIMAMTVAWTGGLAAAAAAASLARDWSLHRPERLHASQTPTHHDSGSLMVQWWEVHQPGAGV